MRKPIPFAGFIVASGAVLAGLAAWPGSVWAEPGDAANAAQESGAEGVRVTVDNFIRAETDTYFAKFVNDSELGKFKHERELVSLDEQTVIRMNRDTLYSSAVFDLAAGPVTITLPDSGKRFLSLQVIDQDHFTPKVIYAPSRLTLREDDIGTRYVAALVRTFVNPNDPADVKAAHALQDGITVEQKDVGSFEVLRWDQASLNRVRDALNAVTDASGGLNSDRMFGSRPEVDPVYHLLGTAAGWGGNPRHAAMYFGVTPERNDGKTPYVMTLEDVPVDGFWSISVYNKDGFFEKNAKNAYTVNNVTAQRNDDGSVTIHFGEDENAVNYLPITPGWNYLLRLYRPREEILDGSWTPPEAKPAK